MLKIEGVTKSCAGRGGKDSWLKEELIAEARRLKIHLDRDWNKEKICNEIREKQQEQKETPSAAEPEEKKGEKPKTPEVREEKKKKPKIVIQKSETMTE